MQDRMKAAKSFEQEQADKDAERKYLEQYRPKTLQAQDQTLERGKLGIDDDKIKLEGSQKLKAARDAMDAQISGEWGFVGPEDADNVNGWRAELALLNRAGDKAISPQDYYRSKKSGMSEETRKQEGHASDLKTAEAQRGLIGANTLRARADANKPTAIDKPLKLSEAQLKTVSAAGMAKNMLDDLATQFTASKLGGASGFASDVAESVPFVGGKIAPKTAEYNDKRRIVAETFLREATGAAAPAPEIKFYTNLLPSPGDSPEQAQSKIEAFRLAVLSKTQGVIESLRLQGHDDQAGMIESRLNALFADGVNIGETETQRARKAGASGSWDKPQAATEQDSEAVQWAKQNPNDPRAREILRLNGAK